MACFSSTPREALLPLQKITTVFCFLSWLQKGGTSSPFTSGLQNSPHFQVHLFSLHLKSAIKRASCPYRVLPFPYRRAQPGAAGIYISTTHLRESLDVCSSRVKWLLNANLTRQTVCYTDTSGKPSLEIVWKRANALEKKQTNTWQVIE